MKKQEAIRDARALGTPKMLVLGLQHLFAMFGATVLVPVITGLSMSADMDSPVITGTSTVAPNIANRC